MSDGQTALAIRLRDGGELRPPRGRMLGLCGAMAVLGLLLTVLAEGELGLVVFGAVVAVAGAVMTLMFALGWQVPRWNWLAREGLVFETATTRYHVPWDAISKITLVRASVLSRVQLTVRDVEEVVQTVRRKRRGGKHKAQARLRRSLGFLYKAGKCHVEFLPVGFGVGAEELQLVLAGYVAGADSRAELRALPVPEDTSG
jgi:hypothetical protein